MWLLADIMRRFQTHYAWNRDRLGDPRATAFACAWDSVNAEIDAALYGPGKPRRGPSLRQRVFPSLTETWPLDV